MYLLILQHLLRNQTTFIPAIRSNEQSGKGDRVQKNEIQRIPPNNKTVKIFPVNVHDKTRIKNFYYDLRLVLSDLHIDFHATCRFGNTFQDPLHYTDQLES